MNIDPELHKKKSTLMYKLAIYASLFIIIATGIRGSMISAEYEEFSKIFVGVYLLIIIPAYSWVIYISFQMIWVIESLNLMKFATDEEQDAAFTPKS